MRSSKGFTLQPLQPGAASPMIPRSNMMGLPPKAQQSTSLHHSNLPTNQQFDSDRLVFLEEENAQLKNQLKEANELIARLREENAELT